MSGIAFLVDPPADVALAEGQDTATSRVQIAKTGRFKDPRYGSFAITRDDFARWLSNFEKHHGGDRAGLPIDVDHGPEKRGDTEAAGWAVALDTMGRDGKTSTPDELWATVQWTSLGVELVQGRRYLYLSPSYHHDFKDEQGKSHGTALVGVGLTNRPFLSMATVSLSADLDGRFAEELPPEPPVDSPPTMKLPATILQKLGLGDDATEEQVLSKLTELETAGAEEPPASKSLDALAGEQGKVVLDAEAYTTLTTNAAAGAAAAKELSNMRFDGAWDKALSQGKVTPAQRENIAALYGTQPDMALKILEDLPAGVVNVEAKGADGAPAPVQLSASETEGQAVDQDMARVDARAQVLAAEKNIDYSEAVVLAAAELGV